MGTSRSLLLAAVVLGSVSTAALVLAGSNEGSSTPYRPPGAASVSDAPGEDPIPATGEPDGADTTSCDNQGHSFLDCVKDEIRATVAADGPEAAVVYLDGVFVEQPQMKANCHGLYHVVGRAAAEGGQLPTYANADCQYGFIHGVLQGLGMQYVSAEEFLDLATPYCMRFDSNMASDCGHGLGHAAAMATPADIFAAIEACGALSPEWIALDCAGGAFMEYGEDLMRDKELISGDNGASSDNGEIQTDVTGVDVWQMCSSVPRHVQQQCYARLWMFAIPSVGITEAVESIGTVVERACAPAPDPAWRAECEIGFGGFTSRLMSDTDERYEQWPPDTAEQADWYGRAMVDGCAQHPNPGNCLVGYIAATISHLITAEYPAELIPAPCRYVEERYAAACAEGMRRAELLGTPPADSGS